MNILFLDLELNKLNDEGVGDTTDIIQIGAVILNVESKQIIGRYESFIKLKTPLTTGELRLSKYITTLTGIADNDIARGKSLQDAYLELCDFCNKYNASRIAATWGGGDLNELRKQLGLVDHPWHFSKYESTNFFDVKKLYQSYRIKCGLNISGGLRTAMKFLNLKFNGRAHNALADAENTAYVWLALINKWS
jgi:inhibitor of KinA sporulation pathway (predicted exonuclease)